MSTRPLLGVPLLVALAAVGVPDPGVDLLGARGEAPDTVVAVEAGDRIRVELAEGRLVVEAGADDRLVVDDGGLEEGIVVVRRGSQLTVRPGPEGIFHPRMRCCQVHYLAGPGPVPIENAGACGRHQDRPLEG